MLNWIQHFRYSKVHLYFPIFDSFLSYSWLLYHYFLKMDVIVLATLLLGCSSNIFIVFRAHITALCSYVCWTCFLVDVLVW